MASTPRNDAPKSLSHKRGRAANFSSRGLPEGDYGIGSKSRRLFDRAGKMLIGGVNSPVRAFKAVGGQPIFIERGEGPFLFDVDGRRYVDLVCSWGACLLGHADPLVVEAVAEAAGKGLSFGANIAAEAELAERVVSALPSIERIRFVSSGTEATMSAIRLARAGTARKKIIKFIGCYHGHVDSLLVAAGSGAATFGTPDSAGVPKSFAETTLLAPYNDLSAVERIMSRHGDDVAAIIVEPIAGNMGFVEPVDGFLSGLRALCDRSNSLLIFDEVMTGFRVTWGGCQTIWNIRPDLTCLGKVIGGGMPFAAYGGRRDLMEQVSPLGPVYQAGTLSGHPLAMAAGLATLRKCDEEIYGKLSAASEALVRGLREASMPQGIPLQAGGHGGLWGFAFSPRPVRNFEDARACDHALYARFFHEMLDRGVFLPPSGFEAMFVTTRHGEVIDLVLDAAADAFRSVAR